VGWMGGRLRVRMRTELGDAGEDEDGGEDGSVDDDDGGIDDDDGGVDADSSS
jgi:hypothetical protein